jgi:purine-binding chemotaxis protein CheW
VARNVLALTARRRGGQQGRSFDVTTPARADDPAAGERRPMVQLDALSSGIRFGQDSGQYLTFTLGGEEYGVEILKVQEIRGYGAVTPIPKTPAEIKGVMNLRGTVIPVVDLRTKLGMADAAYTPFTVIVVVTVGTKVLGLVVDAVSDVLNIPGADVQPTPDFGPEVNARFIGGMAKATEKLVVLLDLDEILGDQDLSRVSLEKLTDGLANN